MQLDFDFLQFHPQLRISRKADTNTNYVHDPIRRKELVLTPEELLRQLVLRYLLDHKRYPANRIRVEIGIEINGLKKRCDIVVFDADIKPWLLVECKSPKVALAQSTFEQAARYNMHLQAPFLAITNGLATFCCSLDLAQKSFAYLPDFPDWPLEPNLP